MTFHPAAYDILVVGAGHAGCEAALAAARMGCRVLLLAIDLDKLAAMPCSPSIGGMAKGQLVKEIDALGGEMGRIADRTAVHFRLLNASKGPAVRSSRFQCDKQLYRLAMKTVVEKAPHLHLRQGRFLRGEREPLGERAEDALEVPAAPIDGGDLEEFLPGLGLEMAVQGQAGDVEQVVRRLVAEELPDEIGRGRGHAARGDVVGDLPEVGVLAAQLAVGEHAGHLDLHLFMGQPRPQTIGAWNVEAAGGVDRPGPVQGSRIAPGVRQDVVRGIGRTRCGLALALARLEALAGGSLPSVEGAQE